MIRNSEMTRKQKVLELLVKARRFNYTYKCHGEIVSDGWVPAHVICSVEAGGLEGTRRLRELRENGINIELRAFIDSEGNRTNTTLYRIVTPDNRVDLKSCKVLPVIFAGETKIDQYSLF